jgi:hypothetical protein
MEDFGEMHLLTQIFVTKPTHKMRKPLLTVGPFDLFIP